MFYHSLTLSLQAKVIVVMATDTGAWDFYDRNQSGGDRMAALLRLPDIQLSSEIRCGVSTHIRYSWFDVTTLPEREKLKHRFLLSVLFPHREIGFSCFT